MAKRSKKRRAWTATEVRDLKSTARKRPPAARLAKKLPLRSTAGRHVITSPARSATDVMTWSEAFNDK